MGGVGCGKDAELIVSEVDVDDELRVGDSFDEELRKLLIFADDGGPEGLGLVEALGARDGGGGAGGNAVEEKVADLGGVCEGAFLNSGEGLVEGAMEIEAGENEHEERDEENRTEAEAGFEGEVAVGHGVLSWRHGAGLRRGSFP